MAWPRPSENSPLGLAFAYAERRNAEREMCQTYERLARADARIHGLMKSGIIRLIDVKFLLARCREDGAWRLPRLQELEDTKRYPGALLDPAAAAALLPIDDVYRLAGDRPVEEAMQTRFGQYTSCVLPNRQDPIRKPMIEKMQSGNLRNVFCLSYAWLGVFDPDPEGRHMRRIFEFFSHLEEAGRLPSKAGLFWDFGCLPQAPRTERQDDVFYSALKAMPDLYASPFGTTVILLQSIPSRPKQYDRCVLVCRLPEDTRKEDIAAVFTVPVAAVECFDSGAASERYARIRYPVGEFEHTDAERATKQASMNELGPGVFCSLEYKDTAYKSRGWCIMESSVARDATRVHSDNGASMRKLVKLLCGTVSEPQEHPNRCDRSGQPIVGIRYQLRGTGEDGKDSYDLCEAEWEKLSVEEQADYREVHATLNPKVWNLTAEDMQAESSTRSESAQDVATDLQNASFSSHMDRKKITSMYLDYQVRLVGLAIQPDMTFANSVYACGLSGAPNPISVALHVVPPVGLLLTLIFHLTGVGADYGLIIASTGFMLLAAIYGLYHISRANAERRARGQRKREITKLKMRFATKGKVNAASRSRADHGVGDDCIAPVPAYLSLPSSSSSISTRSSLGMGKGIECVDVVVVGT